MPKAKTPSAGKAQSPRTKRRLDAIQLYFNQLRELNGLEYATQRINALYTYKVGPDGVVEYIK